MLCVWQAAARGVLSAGWEHAGLLSSGESGRDPRLPSAPHQRQILSVPNGIGTDGMFHAHLADPKPRKRKATIACEDGHVGESHRSFEWSVQDVYGEVAPHRRQR